MDIVKDSRGQSSAELVLLFGGVIIIVVLALMVYNMYNASANAVNAEQDVKTVVDQVTAAGR